ncbi:MAG: glycosyltransferase family 2 protein [bacterium]|nr:glycosyltransferase family 2 protein [bacterium]
MNDKIYIVIPSYEPNFRLLDLIDDLNSFFKLAKIIVVNDGTKELDIFNEVEKKENVTLLTHEVNRGKGAALKTAFTYLKSLNEKMIIATIDSDGQHLAKDIYRCINHYKNINEGLLLGSRMFEGDVPLKSRIGNNSSRYLIRCCMNRYVYDSQTGLRVFNDELLDFLLKVKGNRFEYEMNMIIDIIKARIPLNEVKISTVYFDNNAKTHFRPIKDFLKICGVILIYHLPYTISLFLYIISFILLELLVKNPAFTNFSLIVSTLIFIYLPYILNRLNILNGTRYIDRYMSFYFTKILSFVGLNTCLYLLFNLAVGNILSMFLALIITVISYNLYNTFTSVKKEIYLC